MGQPAEDIVDFYDGTVYNEVREHDPRFAEDARHIMLGLAFDGFLPFTDDDKYSMWPLVITPYNFPPSIRCVTVYHNTRLWMPHIFDICCMA